VVTTSALPHPALCAEGWPIEFPPRMSTPRFVPLDLVAQAGLGGVAAGVGSVLSHPAMAPVYGALAALVVAFVQYLSRRLNPQASEDDKRLQVAVAEGVRVALEAHRVASNPPPANSTQAKLPGVVLALVGLGMSLLAGLAVVGTSGCAGTQLPFATTSRGVTVYTTPSDGKCVQFGLDMGGGGLDGGVTLSARVCALASGGIGESVPADAGQQVDSAAGDGPRE
jgi:hypothetical protein